MPKQLQHYLRVSSRNSSSKICKVADERSVAKGQQQASRDIHAATGVSAAYYGTKQQLSQGATVLHAEPTWLYWITVLCHTLVMWYVALQPGRISSSPDCAFITATEAQPQTSTTSSNSLHAVTSFGNKRLLNS
jgi:hypothetical protein